MTRIEKGGNTQRLRATGASKGRPKAPENDAPSPYQTTAHDSGLVCPLCGHRHNDAADFCADPQVVECECCGREFECWAERQVIYYERRLRLATPDESG